MKKLLYILNIANRVNSFSYTSMKAAQESDYEFHIAGNWGYKSDEERQEDEKKLGIHIYQIDFIRTPYHPGNIRAYRQLESIIKKENFDIIHCNTPIGGVVGRLLGRKYRIPVVIYQVHGFHFYDGAPWLNWALYYPVEKWLARYTDVLITINQEDYNRAQKLKLKKQGHVEYVPGVGLDPTLYTNDKKIRKQKRAELGVNEDDVVLISAGDLVKRKNYAVSLKAISNTGNKKLQYYICGKGPEEEKLKVLATKLGIKEQVHFLGFRSDIKELLAASDIFLFTTTQEGLPRSLSEAMATGLPCITSKIRGNIDLIENGKGGLLCNAFDVDAFSHAINRLALDKTLREKMAVINQTRIKEFDISASKQELLKIYRNLK